MLILTLAKFGTTAPHVVRLRRAWRHKLILNPISAHLQFHENLLHCIVVITFLHNSLFKTVQSLDEHHPS